MLGCQVEGEVSADCLALIPTLPECVHEDGAVRGCLWINSDGRVFWEVLQ